MLEIGKEIKGMGYEGICRQKSKIYEFNWIANIWVIFKLMAFNIFGIAKRWKCSQSFQLSASKAGFGFPPFYLILFI